MCDNCNILKDRIRQLKGKITTMERRRITDMADLWSYINNLQEDLDKLRGEFCDYKKKKK